MSDDYTYLVAGVADTDRRMMTRAVPFAAGVSIRRSSLVIPGRHGVLPGAGPVVLDEAKLAIEWELVAPTWAALDGERHALVALLSRPGDVLVTRRVDAIDTSAACRLESIADAESDYASPLTTLTALLAVPGALWRAGPVTSASIPAQADTTAEVVALAGCSGPVPDAVARVTGPATGLTLTDPVSGTGLSWAGALTSVQYLYLDAGSLTARVSTSSTAWASGGTDASAALGYPPAGPLQLWPAVEGVDPTDRRVRLAVTGTGRGASTAVTVRAAPSYL